MQTIHSKTVGQQTPTAMLLLTQCSALCGGMRPCLSSMHSVMRACVRVKTQCFAPPQWVLMTRVGLQTSSSHSTYSVSP